MKVRLFHSHFRILLAIFLRLKVETQLLSWLQKYDVEMADKQVELDDFTEKYDEEMRKCKELEVSISYISVFCTLWTILVNFFENLLDVI